jgi:hypothetical protein
MTRKEVETMIEELQVNAMKEGMALQLLKEEKDEVGFDHGSERLIVMTRIKLKVAKMPSEREMMSQIAAMMSQIAAMVSTGEKPKGLDDLIGKDELADKLKEELEEIEGIRTVKIAKYEVLVEKTRMFKWDEIVPQVIEVLVGFKLKREFEKDGLNRVGMGNA